MIDCRKIDVSRRRYISCILLLVCLVSGCGQEEIFTSRIAGKKLSPPPNKESLDFIIFGDRTTGNASGLKILKQAVKEANAINPEFVINVGDMIQGYNDQKPWVAQANEYLDIMAGLQVPWFPVAGNHDIYWRGEGRPANEHEDNYETFFGPVWYAFASKNSAFIVLFSDEGDKDKGVRRFDAPQVMSPEQTQWLAEALKKYSAAEHIFIFLHQPRWLKGSYGSDWDRVHKLLADAGNVSAVFAGHVHKMQYYGARDSIEYYTLATTGGELNKSGSVEQGFLHHYNLVAVQGDKFSVSVVPVGAIINPKKPAGNVLEIMPKQDWVIKDEENRVLEYAVELPTFEGTGTIRIKVHQAADDSGDKGMHCLLLDASDEIVKERYMNSGGLSVLEYRVSSDSDWTIRLMDTDTAFEGQNPGNVGSISVELEASCVAAER